MHGKFLLPEMNSDEITLRARNGIHRHLVAFNPFFRSHDEKERAVLQEAINRRMDVGTSEAAWEWRKGIDAFVVEANKHSVKLVGT